MILSVLSLSFCAQKEAPSRAPVGLDPTSRSTPNRSTTLTDTAKKLVGSEEFHKGSLFDTIKLNKK